MAFTEKAHTVPSRLLVSRKCRSVSKGH